MPNPEPPATTSADAVMAEVQQRVREQVRATLLAHGAAVDLSDARVFDAVDALFRQAALRDDRQGLLIPQLFDERWSPDLSLQFGSHRQPMMAGILLFFKRRVLLPLMRWLYEYTVENFKRQDRVNVVLMACLQACAAEQVRLQLRVDALEAAMARGQGAPPPAPPPAS